MHPLPQIDGCSCTLRTRTNQGPVLKYRNGAYFEIETPNLFCQDVIPKTNVFLNGRWKSPYCTQLQFHDIILQFEIQNLVNSYIF